jgi:hypothetical protein
LSSLVVTGPRLFACFLFLFCFGSFFSIFFCGFVVVVRWL